MFAFPGRVNDIKSEGCNFLIKNNKAALITSADDILENMGWKKKKSHSAKKQRELFIELTDDEKIVVNILQTRNRCILMNLF